MGQLKEGDYPPEIDGYELFLDCFNELSSTRNFGMAAGPIPFNYIHSFYCIMLEDTFSFEFFLKVIRMIDNDYLSRMERKTSGNKHIPNKRT